MTTKSKKVRGRAGTDADAMTFLTELVGGALTFATMMRSLRECEDWTQKEMARRLGLTTAHVCDIEQGRKSVSPSRAARFAKRLGYSERQFVRLALQDLLQREGVRMKVTVQPA